ncbi:hypothetical protein ACWCQL_10545 [Streptomyces sp. NPDC002073]
MSESEHSGHGHDRGDRPTGTGVNSDRASAWEHPPASWRPATPEQRDGRVARQEQPVPPGDRLAHLGHIEHPVEMYTVMKPVPNTVPLSAGTDEWIASFDQAAMNQEGRA